MLLFLLSAFFMVSADEEISLTGFVKDNILLPCNCTNIDLKQDFHWQLEGDENKGTASKTIFKYNSTSKFTDKEFKTFLYNNSGDCSILLKNITSDDQGKYTCRFHRFNGFNSKTIYKRPSVTLKVCGQNISQYNESTPGGGKVYHCNVTLDCNRETDIQWTLDGRCLTNSPASNIFITFNNTGDLHFHSTLKTNSTDGSEPKCEVNPACSTNFSSLCDPEYQHPDPFLKMLCKVVPVVLILGFLLIWCRRHGPSHRLLSAPDVENGDLSETSTSSDKLQNENLLSSYPEKAINH